MDIRHAATAVIITIIIILAPLISSASQTIVINITVNGINKGEFFVALEDDGDFLVKAEDLSAMGFRDPEGRASMVEGEKYMSLRSIQGVVFNYSEKTLSLDINSDPMLLTKSTIDLQSRRPKNVYYPRDTSAFLNYRLNYIAGDSMRFRSWGVNNQLGIRTGDILLLGDTAYTKTDTYSRLARLMTSLTYDRREDLLRGVAGDIVASSRDLGATLNMGGLGFSKVYRMDPYFIKYPTLDITGLASTASDVEIYIDDIRLATEKISPGEFELKNISRYSGAHKVEIVLRDPYGRVQRIVHPFYQTETLLKKGLHDFSYNAGFLRRGFGTDSFNYGDAAFSFYHLYGVTSSLTAGARGEAGGGAANAGIEVSINTGTVGTATVAASAGRSDAGASGAAGSLNHSYYGRKVSTRFLLRGFSRDWANIGDAPGRDNSVFDLGAGASYTETGVGTFSLDYSHSKRHSGSEGRTVSAGYSRSLWRTATLFTTVKRKSESNSHYEVFAGLVYYFGDDSSASLSYQKVKDSSTISVQAQRPAPAMGEGMGVRASAERTTTRDFNDVYSFNPVLDYNTRYAIFRGDFREVISGGVNTESYEFSAAGAIASVGGVTGLTRPIYDSFGLVKTGDLNDVKVHLNNQHVGDTDERGLVLVPYLSAYHNNQVSINDKDVPIEYTLSNISMLVSPPLRSGSCLVFTATKTQAFTGTLKTMVSGEVVPLEYYEVTVRMWDRDIKFPSGKNGEFYFDSVESPEKSASMSGGKMDCASITGRAETAVKEGARYTGYADYDGKRCAFEFTVPVVDAPFIELGEITCSTVVSTEQTPPGGKAPDAFPEERPLENAIKP